MRLVLYSILLILIFTGCSKNRPVYKVTATNINKVQKISNLKFPNNSLASYIYEDGIGEVYTINTSLFSRGKELVDINYSTFHAENIVGAYYSALKYGKDNNFKYITFVYPTAQINLNHINDNTESFLKHLKRYGKNYAKRAFRERQKFMYKYDITQKNSTLISNIYEIGAKYYITKPTNYLVFEIQEMITHLEENYGFKNSKVFNIPIGLVKNQESQDINSEVLSLNTIEVIQQESKNEQKWFNDTKTTSIVK